MPYGRWSSEGRRPGDRGARGTAGATCRVWGPVSAGVLRWRTRWRPRSTPRSDPGAAQAVAAAHRAVPGHRDHDSTAGRPRLRARGPVRRIVPHWQSGRVGRGGRRTAPARRVPGGALAAAGPFRHRSTSRDGPRSTAPSVGARGERAAPRGPYGRAGRPAARCPVPVTLRDGVRWAKANGRGRCATGRTPASARRCAGRAAWKASRRSSPGPVTGMAAGQVLYVWPPVPVDGSSWRWRSSIRTRSTAARSRARPATNCRSRPCVRPCRGRLRAGRGLARQPRGPRPGAGPRGPGRPRLAHGAARRPGRPRRGLPGSGRAGA
ncbi:hypothetical protein SALBM135S_02270 [Streptomyces alboniger]